MKAAAAGEKYEIVSLIGWLTAFVSDTTKTFAEHGALPGFRQLDVGNIGLHPSNTSIWSTLRLKPRSWSGSRDRTQAALRARELGLLEGQAP